MAADVEVLTGVSNLYLPTSNGYLRDSTEIVFNDDAAYADRIKNLQQEFLVNLAECQLTASSDTDHRKLVGLLPVRIRPLMLTSIVEEVDIDIFK